MRQCLQNDDKQKQTAHTQHGLLLATLPSPIPQFAAYSLRAHYPSVPDEPPDAIRFLLFPYSQDAFPMPEILRHVASTSQITHDDHLASPRSATLILVIHASQNA